MRIHTIILLIGIGLLACACSEKDHPVSQTEGQPLTFSATISSNQTTSRVNDGPITSGRYYLTFTNGGGSQQTVSALFDSGTGYPFLSNSDGTADPLTWGYIKNDNNNCILTLDNVPGESTSESVVTLNESYEASAYDESNSSNDIVWGKVITSYNKSPIEFTLSHQMACVQVNIDTEEEDIEKLIEKGVTVSLLGIKAMPKTFNRATGEVSVKDDTKNVELLNGTLDGYGNTPTFIFPPQTFTETYRPQLQIKLSDNKTYTGALPRVMFTGTKDENEDDPISSYELAFSAGKKLTIYVDLKESIKEQEILFLPAVVEDWVDKGKVTIVSPQLGIYTEKDYEAVVDAYNKENKEILERYATYSETDGKWTICIFANIGQTGSEGPTVKFNNGNSLNLKFNGHTVYGYGEKDQENLIEETTEKEEVEP